MMRNLIQLATKNSFLTWQEVICDAIIKLTYSSVMKEKEFEPDESDTLMAAFKVTFSFFQKSL